MGTIDFAPLWITLKTGIVASVFSFFIGIAFAELVINTKGRVRAFWDGLLTLPMVLPPTVAGYILLRIFSTRRPLGSFLSNSMGIQVVHTWHVCSFPLFNTVYLNAAICISASAASFISSFVL